MDVIKTKPPGTVDLAMSAFCFLCNADISQGSMKTKRKRLSDARVKKAVGVRWVKCCQLWKKDFTDLWQISRL